MSEPSKFNAISANEFDESKVTHNVNIIFRYTDEKIGYIQNMNIIPENMDYLDSVIEMLKSMQNLDISLIDDTGFMMLSHSINNITNISKPEIKEKPYKAIAIKSYREGNVYKTTGKFAIVR